MHRRQFALFLLMSSASKHNEFINDTNELFNNILILLDQNGQLQLSNAVSIYMTKWDKIFTPAEVEDNSQKLKNKEEKVQDLYNELKRSVIHHHLLPDITPTNAESTIHRLQYLLEKEKLERARSQSTQYEIGMVLCQLKNMYKSKKAFAFALEGIMSVGYAYKVINFYYMCLQYSNLKCTSLSFTKILTNLKELETLMKCDVEFWNTQ